MTYFSYISFIFLLSVLSFVKAIETFENETSEAKDYGCLCEHLTCGCCAHIDAPKIGLNDTACVNITYLPNEYGIHFSLNIDKLYIYNETISVRNPPPICAGAPILKDYAELCIHFYDLDATMTKLHGCVDVEARLRKIVIARYKFGCFNIGKLSNNMQKWRKHTLELIEKLRFINKMSSNML